MGVCGIWSISLVPRGWKKEPTPSGPRIWIVSGVNGGTLRNGEPLLICASASAIPPWEEPPSESNPSEVSSPKRPAHCL